MDKRQAVGQMIRAAEAGEVFTITKATKPVAVVISHARYQELMAAAAHHGGLR